MKAIRVHEFRGPEVLPLEEVPEPQHGSAVASHCFVSMSPLFLRYSLVSEKP
jgi:hypothetical protein